MQYCSLKGDQICILDPYPTSRYTQHICTLIIYVHHALS